ncbi:hypothetical protein QYM36_008615, partial [Artemia franciscana]
MDEMSKDMMEFAKAFIDNLYTSLFSLHKHLEYLRAVLEIQRKEEATVVLEKAKAIGEL